MPDRSGVPVDISMEPFAFRVNPDGTTTPSQAAQGKNLPHDWLDIFNSPDLSNYTVQNGPAIISGGLLTGTDNQDTILSLNPNLVGNPEIVCLQAKFIAGPGSGVAPNGNGGISGGLSPYSNENPPRLSVYTRNNPGPVLTLQLGATPIDVSPIVSPVWARLLVIRGTVLAQLFTSDPAAQGTPLVTSPLVEIAGTGQNPGAQTVAPTVEINQQHVGNGRSPQWVDNFYVWTMDSLTLT